MNRSSKDDEITNALAIRHTSVGKEDIFYIRLKPKVLADLSRTSKTHPGTARRLPGRHPLLFEAWRLLYSRYPNADFATGSGPERLKPLL